MFHWLSDQVGTNRVPGVDRQANAPVNVGCIGFYTKCKPRKRPLGEVGRMLSGGTWRSLAARSVRDAEVAGSNPAVPTIDG